MERSEPSLVPEWLRSTGGGGLSHHFPSSQSDGPLLALPMRNKLSNSTNKSNARQSSFQDWSSSRSFSSNGSNKRDKIPYSRSFSSCNRNQHSKDREKLGVHDSWGSDYSDPLTSSIGKRLEKSTLGRSQSTNSRRAVELSQSRVTTDQRNKSHDVSGNGHGAMSVAGVSTGTRKVSFERDFPLLVSDERPKTPDLVRLPSPGLSKGVQGLSIGGSSLIGGEGWTSALAEVPVGVVGSNSAPSSNGLQQPIQPVDSPPSPASASASNASLVPNGLNMAAALSQAPVRTHSIPQQSVQIQRSEELPSVGTKKLIPLTPSSPRPMVLNPSDKLKPKTTARSYEGAAGPKNGLHQMPSLQLGSQVRGGSVLADGKSSSTGMLLLKPGRASPAFKDHSSQTNKVTSAVSNGPSVAVPSVTSVPFKTSNNMKQFSAERKTPARSSSSLSAAEKRLSLAQLQSRNDFFNLMRQKSVDSTSVAADSDTEKSSSRQTSGDGKVVACEAVTVTDNGSEVKCNGDTCKLAETCSDQSESALSHCEVIYPDEEELNFLRALGWEADAGDDEGLTDEEIVTWLNKYKKWRPDSKLFQELQLKMTAGLESQGFCSADVSSELSASTSSV